jgi:PhnB protein
MSVSPVPDGYATVTPWVVTRDTARMIDFIEAAFDGHELDRVTLEDGSIGHAEVRIGDSVVMLFDARETWLETPALLRLYVTDVDAVFRQALRAGAVVITELRSHPWGDRVGRVRDPLGNIWWLQQRVEEVTPDEMNRRWGLPKYIENMRYTQDSLDRELSSRRSVPPMG